MGAFVWSLELAAPCHNFLAEVERVFGWLPNLRCSLAITG